ncbi:hypothetical protein APY04_1876 [Hyphomicrobium sulfonivorans]|uniref:Uncharacterized protein n=1 Tax=Hyphomicrobium sulfonivorans TaxID=121290 RepID=A0A109BG46_HYPSL|nr:hypothetical protein [Hyphomicrobium sulfonivorans]KWT67517.1 hypothetical protein APY04_1876 [Hyphomicrobium sulfonivorans]
MSDLTGRVFEHRHVKNKSLIRIMRPRFCHCARRPAQLGRIRHGYAGELDQNDQNPGFLRGKLQATAGCQIDWPNGFEDNGTERLATRTLQSRTQSIDMSAQPGDDEAIGSKREPG